MYSFYRCKLIISASVVLFLMAIYQTVMGQDRSDEEKVRIAVIHGATFGDPDKFGEGVVEKEGEFTVETSLGTSPPITRMRYKGVPFYFFRGFLRNPAGSLYPPGWEKVKAFAALHQLGVTHVLGGDICGSINTGYDFDDFVVVDDFILMDNQRPQNILQVTGIKRPGVFPNFETPFCPDLRRLYTEVSMRLYDGRVHTGGVMVQDDPGRFETPAEIRRMRLFGGDLVSHDSVTDAVYARQLGMHFALLDSVSNPAVGVRPFTFRDMQESVQRIAAGGFPILLECIVRLTDLEQTCGNICIGEPVEGTFTDPEAKTDENLY